MKARLTLIAMATVLATAGPAAAQQTARNCAPRAVVVERLAEGYDEVRRAAGLAANRQLVEVFASALGSWTITVTNPAGLTCLIASGLAFEGFDAAPPAPGTDS